MLTFDILWTDTANTLSLLPPSPSLIPHFIPFLHPFLHFASPLRWRKKTDNNSITRHITSVTVPERRPPQSMRGRFLVSRLLAARAPAFRNSRLVRNFSSKSTDGQIADVAADADVISSSFRASSKLVSGNPAETADHVPFEGCCLFHFPDYSADDTKVVPEGKSLKLGICHCAVVACCNLILCCC